MKLEAWTWLDYSLLTLAIAAAVVMLRPSLRTAEAWRATVTPLASIIGSGFLVVVPLLAAIEGANAVYAILGIVLLSLWMGASLRYCIRHAASATEADDAWVRRLERTSEVALAAAYAISVAFYIRLMSGFLLADTAVDSDFNADLLSTLVLAGIGAYGGWRGLRGLESLETYAVTLKLAIIAALLAGLAHHIGTEGYQLSAIPSPRAGTWEAVRELAGMLLIVQGFETSKYLGATYSAEVRARSMWHAQLLAGAIYVLFVALAMPLMSPLADQTPDETAIIGVSSNVALVLPMMLVVAAAMSQFSAAIADTLGAGGLLENESRGRLHAKLTYPLVTAVAIVLIWTTHIFEVIALASRAFALYYLLQALLAARLTLRTEQGHGRTAKLLAHLLLAALMLFVVVFAIPAEG